MMVLFLVGLVTMIMMRTLRRDYARYSKDDDLDDLERDLGDEYGWKQVHGDVFRPPAYNLAFSTLVGTGYHVRSPSTAGFPCCTSAVAELKRIPVFATLQVLLVSMIVILFSIWGDIYVGRGSLVTTIIFVYAGCAPIAGYFGGGLYSRNSGEEWIKQVLANAVLLPATVCGVAVVVNFIAMYYHASRAIPFRTMVRQGFA